MVGKSDVDVARRNLDKAEDLRPFDQWRLCQECIQIPQGYEQLLVS